MPDGTIYAVRFLQSGSNRPKTDERAYAMKVSSKTRAGTRNVAVKDLTVLQLRFQGHSLNEIAKQLNVTRSLVVARIKRLRDPKYVIKRDRAYYAGNKQWIKEKRALK
jgi:biotin operon repressor